MDKNTWARHVWATNHAPPGPTDMGSHHPPRPNRLELSLDPIHILDLQSVCTKAHSLPHPLSSPPALQLHHLLDNSHRADSGLVVL